MFKTYLSAVTRSFQQAVDLSVAASQAPKFIRDHKLWLGFFEHKWVSLFSLIVAMLFSYLLINNFMGNDETERDNEENIALDERSDDGDDQDTDVKNFDEPVVLNEDNDREDKDEDDDDDEDDEDEDDKMNDKIKKEGGVFFFSGGMKYLLIIFLEVFIFHFSVKSYSILKGKQTVLKLNDFYQAEKRMLIVMLQCLVKTWLAYLFLSIVFGVFGFEFLKKPLMFLVYSYFIGYAFLDNYNEQHEISIKNSDKIIRKRFGASIALGMLCSLLMLIPVIGPFSSPLFCAVIATLYGYRHQLELVNPK